MYTQAIVFLHCTNKIIDTSFLRLATSRLRNARQDKESEGRSPESSDEVAKRERRSRESTCSACIILNLICILLARKNWV